MNVLDRILFVFLSALVAYNVREYLKHKKPEKAALIVFYVLLFLAISLKLILEKI